MAKIRLDIVTAERLTYSEEVDMVIASAVEGQLGILPRHAPLMTMLVPGELRIKKGGQEESLSISGGFLEVRPDRVVILADAAERVEEIDLARAEEARRRAEARLKEKPPETDLIRAELALRRALIRIKVAERRRRRERP